MVTEPCRACGSTCNGYYKPSDRVCRSCRQARNRRWTAANRERVQATRRRYETDYRQELREQSAARRAARTPEATARAAALHREASTRYRESRVAAWLAEHGTPPPCGCGCGTPVGFDHNGTPNRYLAGHYLPPRAVTDAARYKGDRLPIGQARALLEALRTRYGWTLTEMARHAGMPSSTLWALMRKPGRSARHGVDRAIVERIVRSCTLSVTGTPRAYNETEPDAVP
jgi:hypothetical protein